MKNKKILIITHKPEKNYGGIAQAYALQKFLKDLGHDPETTASLGSPYSRYVASNPILRKILRKEPIQQVSPVSFHTRKFINANIAEISFKAAIKKVRKDEYSAYISGSDQVWRRQYANVLDNLFSFVNSTSAPIISYAASFGKDNIEEYGPSLKRKSKKMAQKFEAISVREDSGIQIVQENWNLKAYHHVDPTLLLTAKDYISLIDDPSTPLRPSVGRGIFVYVLDPTSLSSLIVAKAEETLSIGSHKLISGDRNAGKTLPPFEEWLRSFNEAEFVITDSFHGTVFAIIFNKRFLTIGNHARGLARLTSLLNKFSLHDRLVLNMDDATEHKIKADINWKHVNAVIEKEKQISRMFLQQHLERK